MPRRILLLITDLEIGGTPTVVRELATRLHRPEQGVHVEVACLLKWGPVADSIRDAGVTVTALGATRSWQLPGVVRRLRRLVRERSIDTVFSFLIHANSAAALAARGMPGVRFLQSIQTVQENPRWHWWLQGRIHGAAQKVVVPSSAVARAARDRSDVPEPKLIIVPNAIDPEVFPRVSVFQNSPVRVGFLGRLDPVKNVHLFLYTFWEMTRGGVEGHVFGDGPLREHFERLSGNLGVAGRVFFRGAVLRPQEALREMDVLLFPSTGEGFGLVLIEAMASGVPVIAVAAGGVLDVVRHEHNGLLVPADVAPYASRGLLPALERMMDDEALRARLIDGGLTTVRERFTWKVVLPQYRALLQIPD